MPRAPWRRRVLPHMEHFHQASSTILEKEVTNMHYNPLTPVNNIFNKVKDLLKYVEIANCPYSHPQIILKSYNIINKTGKLCKSIKSWNHLPPITKIWIAFKNLFRKVHRELTKTGELTLEQASYGKANLVEDIASRLTAEFQHKSNIENSVPPEDPAPPTATGNAEILQQVFNHNQELV